MNIDHLQFYVPNADEWSRWLVQSYGGQIITQHSDEMIHRCLLQVGHLWVVAAGPRHDRSPIAHYLAQHPPGVGDVGFQVGDLEHTLRRVVGQGGQITQPIQTCISEQGQLRWCQIRGWGDLCHTLVERQGSPTAFPGMGEVSIPNQPLSQVILAIDHAVLNVPQGELTSALTHYERLLGFERRQAFTIKTPHSGLYSQVLAHPDGTAQLPINEPVTPNSQVQEFLNHNRGSGVQHVALQTPNIVDTVGDLRRRGVKFLQVPTTYYTALAQRSGFSNQGLDWPGVIREEILVDWSAQLPQARLLQTFTQPLFQEPTFFFELIERQQAWHQGKACQAEGFGEGNFRALFEAIEREQAQRGSLRLQAI